MLCYPSKQKKKMLISCGEFLFIYFFALSFFKNEVQLMCQKVICGVRYEFRGTI
mgnify:CR=1 FL=1